MRPLAVLALTGVGAGIGGVGLTLLLHLIQHLAFGYTENTFLIGVERASGRRRVLAMAIGGLIVGLGWWAQRAHLRIITVREALREHRPRLPIPSTLFDSILQITAVAFGASLGREGAPRQFGASIGLWLAGRAGLSLEQQRTIMACGAGAGLAAVYNVPLGGALFTLEVLLASAARADIVAAVLTSATATAVAWPVLSNRPTYSVPDLHLTATAFTWAIVFGPIAGVAGAAFMRLAALALRRQPQGWHLPVATTLTFAFVGAVAIWFPQLLGNGKGAAQLAFDAIPTIALLATLAVLKPLATALCLRSGATGGLLTPALATGALLGAAAGGIWTHLWPGSPLAAFAIIGAAAVLATTQRAPLTAIALVIEFTHTGETLLVPIMIAVGTATLTSQHLPGWSHLTNAHTTT
ncbi:H+/Cl-antiporter ClcA [Frankineae bacterium MT45]|nr:H+/Cl-antiporter ClcA [Frankineae bacterium MT45]